MSPTWISRIPSLQTRMRWNSSLHRRQSRWKRSSDAYRVRAEALATCWLNSRNQYVFMWVDRRMWKLSNEIQNAALWPINFTAWRRDPHVSGLFCGWSAIWCRTSFTAVAPTMNNSLRYKYVRSMRKYGCNVALLWKLQFFKRSSIYLVYYKSIVRLKSFVCSRPLPPPFPHACVKKQ